MKNSSFINLFPHFTQGVGKDLILGKVFRFLNYKNNEISKMSLSIKVTVFLFPILVFLTLLYFKISLPDTYFSLIQEDGGLEYAQTLFYFLSAVFSFYVALKFLRHRLILHSILYGILSLGLFSVSFEEISWGQRILQIANPDYFERHNTQKEISFHNLDVIQSKLHKAYIVVGAYGAFGYALMALFISKLKVRSIPIMDFVVPDWFTSPYFFFTFFFYTLVEYISLPYQGSFHVWRDQESVELLLSLGFLFFIASNYIKLRLCLKSSVMTRIRAENGDKAKCS